jgi:Spy/CpxP family protein refolding chaperone
MKRQHFIWIIVLLSVVNLSAVGTIIYRERIQPEATIESPPPQQRRMRIPEGRLGHFFREELNLSPEQHLRFRELRREFHMKADDLTFDMKLLRNEMITELAMEHPDSLVLQEIAEKIGNNHTRLKELTIDYYLGMKEVCTPEQEEKLFEIFDVIINPERPGRGRRHGAGPGRGRKHMF